MAADNVRLARIGFGSAQYVPRLDLLLYEPLLAALAEACVPVVLCYQDIQAVDWPAIADALARWPGLRIIMSLSKITYHDRYFYALWEKFDSLYVELSGYQVLNGIEAVTGRFGPDRLVYGSRSPHFAPLQSMLQVIYSDVEEGVKRSIAGGTVRRLMQQVRWP